MLDPEPSTENPNKFKGFQELYGMRCTSEQYCPSLKEQLCGVDGMDINIKLSGQNHKRFCEMHLSQQTKVHQIFKYCTLKKFQC